MRTARIHYRTQPIGTFCPSLCFLCARLGPVDQENGPLRVSTWQLHVQKFAATPHPTPPLAVKSKPHIKPTFLPLFHPHPPTTGGQISNLQVCFSPFKCFKELEGGRCQVRRLRTVKTCVETV